ncbi:MAG TPA: hypothetical protein VJR67_00610 [Candidatus Nitrosopolaris sp.]|nr:hypothetical protein [Candidatus Nitrosopolaris sp.]
MKRSKRIDKPWSPYLCAVKPPMIRDRHEIKLSKVLEFIRVGWAEELLPLH